MGLLARLGLRSGALRDDLRAALEAEGLVLVEEGLRTTVRYHRFRAPGKRFHGKVVLERAALGISERRLVLYCRFGRAKLIDSDFASGAFAALDLSLDGDAVVFAVDYDRHPDAAAMKVSGQVTITVRTPRAAEIAAEVEARRAAG